jgi:hypothetical protein
VIERRVEFGHAAIEVAQLRRLICGTRVNFSSRRLPDALPAHHPRAPFRFPEPGNDHVATARRHASIAARIAAARKYPATHGWSVGRHAR